MEHPYGKQYSQEGNPRSYMTMRDYRNLPYQWGNQQPVERNPSEHMSMRDYRNLELKNQQPVGRNPNPNMSLREYRDKWMSAPVYHVPSTYPPPPQYDYPEPPFYASTPQSPQSPQPPQSIHPLVEQAILDLTRKVNDYVEENKKVRARSIVTVEDNLNKKIDGLKDDFEHKRDNLQDSIGDLIEHQQPPPLSLIKQAILNLSKQVDNIIEDNRVVNVQTIREIETVKNSLNKRTDGLQSEIDQKLDIQQESILKLVPQFVHQEEKILEEESQEEECLTETVLVEQVQLQPQEELKVESLEAPEELQDTSESGDTFWPRKQEEQTSALISEEESQEEECQNGTMVEEPCLQQPQQGLVENSESLDIGVVVCLWEKEDAIPLLLTEEAVEENKENIFPLPPTDSVYILPLPASQSQHKTNATAQDTKYPLPAAPPDSVFILPIPAPQPTPVENPKPATPAPKGKSNPPLHAMQNIKRLVASVHAFATTSKTMATAYIAWHSGWFGCGFGFGTPGPRHF